MIGKDVAKLKMCRTVQEVCEDNMGVVASNAAFAAAYGTFSGIINDIIDTAEAQGKVITGVTADKNVDREDVSQVAADVAGLVFAYASKLKNYTLMAEVNFSYTDILRLKGDLLIARCNGIYTSAKTNLALLVDYGVTEETLVVLAAKIAKYKKSLPAPRTATSTKNTHTVELEASVKEAVDLLKNQMDKLTVNFKVTYPAFVALYNNARNIVETGTTAKAVAAPAKEGIV